MADIVRRRMAIVAAAVAGGTRLKFLAAECSVIRL
jgi:hypothetical protein